MSFPLLVLKSEPGIILTGELAIGEPLSLSMTLLKKLTSDDSCRQLKKRCLPAGADSKCKHCEKLDYVCTFHYIHRRTGRPRGKNTKVVSESCEEKQDASRRSLAEGLIQGSSPPPQRHRAPGSFQEYQRVESLLQAALHSPRAAVSLSS